MTRISRKAEVCAYVHAVSLKRSSSSSSSRDRRERALGFTLVPDDSQPPILLHHFDSDRTLDHQLDPDPVERILLKEAFRRRGTHLPVTQEGFLCCSTAPCAHFFLTPRKLLRLRLRHAEGWKARLLPLTWVWASTLTLGLLLKRKKGKGPGKQSIKGLSGYSCGERATTQTQFIEQMRTYRWSLYDMMNLGQIWIECVQRMKKKSSPVSSQILNWLNHFKDFRKII